MPSGKDTSPLWTLCSSCIKSSWKELPVYLGILEVHEGLNAGVLCESSDALQVHVVHVEKSPSQAAFEKEAACGVPYHIVGLDAVGAEGGCHQAWSLPSIRVRLVASSVLFKG